MFVNPTYAAFKYTALSFFMVQFYDIMCLLLGKTRREGGDKNEQDF